LFREEEKYITAAIAVKDKLFAGTSNNKSCTPLRGHVSSINTILLNSAGSRNLPPFRTAEAVNGIRPN
jgi:hypothetical protein